MVYRADAAGMMLLPAHGGFDRRRARAAPARCTPRYRESPELANARRFLLRNAPLQEEESPTTSGLPEASRRRSTSFPLGSSSSSCSLPFRLNDCTLVVSRWLSLRAMPDEPVTHFQ